MWHKALLIGYLIRFELTLVSSLNKVETRVSSSLIKYPIKKALCHICFLTKVTSWKHTHTHTHTNTHTHTHTHTHTYIYIYNLDKQPSHIYIYIYIYIYNFFVHCINYGCIILYIFACLCACLYVIELSGRVFFSKHGLIHANPS